MVLTPLALTGAPASPLYPVLASSCAAFSLRHTAVGQALSAPMLSFMMSSALSSAGVIPLAHPAYETCSSVLPLSVCFGLFAASGPADRGGGDGSGELRPMLTAFCVGAIGTVLGCLVGYALCTRCGLLARRPGAVAAALYCATYVGGSVNFFGVAGPTGAASLGGLLPSLLAADLGLMALYLLALTAASRWPRLRRAFPPAPGRDATASAATTAIQLMEPLAQPVPGAPPPPPPPRASHRRRGLSALVLVAVAVCQACGQLERRLRVPGSSTIAICLASAAIARAVRRRLPAVRPLLPLLGAPSLLLCCVFLGGMGASAQLGQVVAAGPAAATLGAVVLFVHCAVMLTGVWLLNWTAGTKISLRTLLVASNANIGGPGTAMAMASAMGWPQLLPAAAACGTIGYSSATLLGIAMHRLLLRVG